jgi:hypothetical protein
MKKRLRWVRIYLAWPEAWPFQHGGRRRLGRRRIEHSTQTVMLPRNIQTDEGDFQLEGLHQSAENVEVYLRRVKEKGGFKYVIRESCKRENCWTHRDLMNLGNDPGAHIRYPGGNGYYIDPEVEDTLQGAGVEYSAQELEEVFLPFLDPHIRRIIEMFRSEGRMKTQWSGCSPDELLLRQEELHSFDKRRLHYLRCGRIDIGRLAGRPWKFLNILLEKSRDEIEHIIEGMEQKLPPHEVRSYLYTAFHIQAYFPNHLLRNHPAGLDPEKVDGYFLEELCYLNEDKRFFRGSNGTGSGSGKLHPYLQKYAILYFDHGFETPGLWGEYAREFARRQFRRSPSSSGSSMSVRDALVVMAVDSGELSCMSREELGRCYRRRAKMIHPDQGGDHESFVRLAEAYQCLLACLGGSQ